ncbi:hypothetical protein GCK32_006223 [Trichostrongylus colubriformis]|uniref:Uncharacterized protein n=1 Tax=Trichostrongylus colubriformis TaxID=6319 RepID=A0AAN8FQ30_TRICO
MTVSENTARISSLNVQDVFDSSKDNELKADVEIANDTNRAYSAQVVFRGYVRRGKTLHYEFLHEQVWIFIRPSESKTHQVSVDAWLPRFPPSIKFKNGFQVEYSVRATIDPWFQNNHVEKTFAVNRVLVLKMPHLSCYRKRLIVNQCVNHGGWYHKNPSPDHLEFFDHHERILISKENIMSSNERHNCEIAMPPDLPVTIAMSLWNVLAIRYELLFQVKMEGHRPFVNFRIPIIIASEQVKSRPGTPNSDVELYTRAQDIDDDTDDDDDQDSDIGETQQDDNDDFSIDIESLEIEGEENLYKAYAHVRFTINSVESQAVRSLRLLLQGEVRAGSVWYCFIRYKAHITSDSNSLFSPGEHSVKISLPFKDSQYDTNILPPSLDDEIRYICRVSTKSWAINDVADERNVRVDRTVDTWAKEEYKLPYSEIVGAYGIKMEQRAFQRGKHVFVTVNGEGNIRNIRMTLEQQRRLRHPGLNKDDSYCDERIVSAMDSPENKSLWPKEWALRIPKHIPPSIEITYRNVLVLNYALKIMLTLEDGHKHTHTVPIWIGCTDDKLPLPAALGNTEKQVILETAKAPDQAKKAAEYAPEEAPPFEVVCTDDTLYPPLWVDRFNDHIYS